MTPLPPPIEETPPIACVTGIQSIVLGIVVLGSISTPVYADVRISEFLYNAEGADGGKEFVEIINTSKSPVQSDAIKLIEHGRKHSIATSVQLQPGEYAVIVPSPEQFQNNYPQFNGVILDSTNFALNNTESTLSILYKDKNVHSISYSKENGANGDGNALYVSEQNVLSTHPPTPGNGKRGITQATHTTAQKQVGSAPREVQSEGKSLSELIVLLTYTPEILFTASEAIYTAVKNSKGQTKQLLGGTWNFGDGTVRYGAEVQHAYLYPGTYTISFVETGADSVTAQISVEVLTPKIRVEQVDTSFVRFFNDHTFTLDVSDWMVKTGRNIFTFPPYSFIQEKKSTVIPLLLTETEPIIIVTKGGGEFLPETLKTLEIKGENREKYTIQKTESVEKEPNTEQTSNTISKKKEEKKRTDKNTLVFIWIALFFGILVMAGVPMYILTKEKEK